MADKKSRLGGASAALMGKRGAEALASLATVAEAGVTELSNAVEIDIRLVAPNPDQPRKTLDPDALRELAESVAEKGILQPIVVRRQGTRFVIVAGERRYRAAQMAGLERVPAMIREVAGEEAIEQSLIENLQRENIDPIEESTSFRQLMQAHGYSMRDLAARLHKSHAYVAERLQLTRHDDIAAAVASGRISPKAASELARVEDAGLRKDLLERVQRGEIDSRHIRQAKRGDSAPVPGAPGRPPVRPAATEAPRQEAVVTDATPRDIIIQPAEAATRGSEETAYPEGAVSGQRVPPKESSTSEPVGPAPVSAAAAHTPEGNDEPEVAQPDGKSAHAEEQPGHMALEAVHTARQALSILDISSLQGDRALLRASLEALARQIEALLEALT